MMRIETSATMPAPADAVYAAVADLRGRPRWLTEMSDVDAPPSPATAGTHFTARSSLLLHSFHGASAVEEADGRSRFREEVHLGARFKSEWTIEPAAAGAVVLRHTIDLDLPSGPLGWLARVMLGRRLRQMSRRSQALLAEQLSRSA
jgi:hypothetical protein